MRHDGRPIRLGHTLRMQAVVWAIVLLAASGCASSKFVTLRSAPKDPLGDQLKLTSYWGPEPSPRTMQLLRVYNLADHVKGDPRPILATLQAAADREPSPEVVYAMAEVSYLEAKRIEKQDPRTALDLYGAAVLHAYHYLFDQRLAPSRNPYDPTFRDACDVYNGALESALRLVCEKRELVPGSTRTIDTASGQWDITCVLRGGQWRPEEIERFEFVSDYEMTGLKNLYQAHGLGVPLIAVRHPWPGQPAAAKYYPPELSFPVTAFLRPVADMAPRPSPTGPRRQGLLELYDPLTTENTRVAGGRVMLEADLTTPLAYFLSKVPLEEMATLGLLHPDQVLAGRAQHTERQMGLFMVQPYEPGKIPVVFVHGLWSSPMTWMEMFNDLRSSPVLRDHYQFWFYLYPTGQPFWLSAAQMRRDLAEVRHTVDPRHEEPALDEMVLVGHSMGGLVSRLQTIDSRNDFWNLVSRHAVDEVKADPDVRRRLEDTFYFRPNPSVRRVVTIGTPHHGSRFSNETTQYLFDKLIHMPERLVNTQQKLFRENPGFFDGSSLLKVDTSIDSLAPDAPIFTAMVGARRPPWIIYHNIIGEVPPKWYLTPLISESDGVVSVRSARVTDAVSELIVPADHTSVHSHPAAVLEVRRILLEHLADLRGPTVAAVPNTSPKR